ncbi:MAG: arginine repressor [Candidatus Nanopelagicaceae bacterium]|nr:arginine repressor [Candidatus Nanopelagicaceae bacterium]
MSIPHTKVARQEMIKDWISQGSIHSQVEIVDRLKNSGFEVTQATVSRDLEEIGAVRGRDSQGDPNYRINQEAGDEPLSKVSRLISDLLVDVKSSGNLTVLRTPPGGAQLLASALDRASRAGTIPEIIGTIAGDDTVLVVSSQADGAERNAQLLLSLAQSEQI